MLVDEEHHELADGLDVVEGIQVEPLMFQDALPRLDERVRETDVGHRQESSERSGFDQLIDSRVEVLNTSVGEKSGWIFGLGGVPRRLEKYQERVPGIETLRDSPSENPAREVVDHRTKVRSSAVKESNHRRVDVPNLVGCCRANTDLWFFRMNPDLLAGPRAGAEVMEDVLEQVRPALIHGQRPPGRDGRRGGDAAALGTFPEEHLTRDLV